jgi:hypothetical protein
MFKRGISVDDVKKIINTGEIINEYPNDKPYPSYLILGFANFKPIHLVIAQEKALKECIIITAYHPDTTLWEVDFKTKKKL